LQGTENLTERQIEDKKSKLQVTIIRYSRFVCRHT